MSGLRGILTALCLASACAGCAPRPSPVPPATDSYYFGHLTRGEKFGVRIGAPAAQARRTLTAHGIRHFADYVGANCSFALAHIVACERMQAIETYNLSEPLRRGLVIVDVEDGRVRSIAWSLYLVTPYPGR